MDKLIGAPIIMIWHQTLGWAVDELAKLGQDQLVHLKVRSGEHLAAILATSFLGVAPSRVDSDGGVDMIFQLPEEKPAPSYFTPTTRRLAFEVKSMPGPFRELNSKIDRLTSAGKSAVGLGLTTQAKAACDILTEARPLLEAAQARLKSKLISASEISRNIFLIAHPFDNFAVELGYPVLGPLLPAMNYLHETDSVWVLWVPDHLTLWSKSKQGWIDLKFNGVNSDEQFSENLPPLQLAEIRFLDSLADKTSSPYLFAISRET